MYIAELNTCIYSVYPDRAGGGQADPHPLSSLTPTPRDLKKGCTYQNSEVCISQNRCPMPEEKIKISDPMSGCQHAERVLPLQLWLFVLFCFIQEWEARLIIVII